MKSFKVRNEANEEFEVNEDRLHEAEKDGYLAVVSNGTDEHRVSSADLPKAVSDGFKPVVSSDMSKTESGWMGALDGLSFGFRDEFRGAAEAIGSTVGLRGLGGGFDEIRLETDEEDKQDFSDIYKERRDLTREQSKESALANPKTYTGSQFAGGVVSGLAAPVGRLASTGVKGAMAAGAIEGGVFGAGESEADNVTDLALDTAKGAAIGAGSVGVLTGAGKLAVAGTKVTKSGGQALLKKLEPIRKGFKVGKKEDAITEGLPIIEFGERALRGMKGATDEVNASAAVTKEISEQAKLARKIIIRPLMESPELSKIQIIASSKRIEALSDDEAILAALLQDGDNPIKQWIANKAATEYPGQITEDAYSSVLNMGTTARKSAKAFDPKSAGKELKPVVEDVQELFKNTRNARFQELQVDAMTSYDRAETNSVVRNLDDAIEDSQVLKSIPSAVKNLLEDVKGMISSGVGTKKQGLTKGPLEAVEASEHFIRLQKSRELLDSKIKWANGHGETQAEQLLSGVRDSIDDALKLSPSKLEADDLYRMSKQIEDKFFGVTEFKKNGSIEIDEFKLAKLLGKTDQAGRFRNAIDEFKEFAARDDLSDDFKSQAKKLIQTIEDKMAIMNQKSELGDFRFNNGPSSPAIERLNSVSNSNSLIQDAVQSPAGFVNQMDEFSKYVSGRVGKPVSQFSPEEKSAMVKVWIMQKNNPDISQSKLNDFFMKQFPRATQ